jgi:hypothetical protein
MPSRLPELVGRLMMDPELLAEIQRAPESVLGQYELSDEERAAVRQASSAWVTLRRADVRWPSARSS